MNDGVMAAGKGERQNRENSYSNSIRAQSTKASIHPAATLKSRLIHFTNLLGYSVGVILAGILLVGVFYMEAIKYEICERMVC